MAATKKTIVIEHEVGSLVYFKDQNLYKTGMVYGWSISDNSQGEVLYTLASYSHNRTFKAAELFGSFKEFYAKHSARIKQKALEDLAVLKAAEVKKIKKS